MNCLVPEKLSLIFIIFNSLLVVSEHILKIIYNENEYIRIGLTSSGELLEDKLSNRALEKGLLLEFKKDSDRVLLAVAQRPDGKKNWMVYDQVLVETTNAAC